jgi:hypothetical protein
MSITMQTRRGGQEARSPWYVYDRHANLLHIAGTLDGAEAWAVAHWEVVEIATKEQMQPNDYWYLLLAASQESGQTRDYQARIMRQDRVIAIGRDPQDPPRFS